LCAVGVSGPTDCVANPVSYLYDFTGNECIITKTHFRSLAGKRDAYREGRTA